MDRSLCLVLFTILIVCVESLPSQKRFDAKINIECETHHDQYQNDARAPIVNKELKIQTLQKYTNTNLEKNVKNRNVDMVGMPFSVLYMNQKRSKNSKNLHKSITTIAPTTTLRTMKMSQRKKFSNFPQLWVSYGWRPSGR